MKNLIKDIIGREILDSRGNPTVEVDIYLENNLSATVSVPSGASTGMYEAYELRDNDKDRYQGKGVLKAVNNINEIIKPALIGKDVLNQEEIDNLLITLDGTKNKQRLGANAILAVSLAVAKVASKLQNVELYEYLCNDKSYDIPTPMMNILNGGCHANNNIDIQEFMIVPVKKVPYKEKLRMCVEVYHSLKTVLKESNITLAGVGDEGGYAPNLKDDEEALEMIIKAINKANYKIYQDFMIALDVASSEWYDKKTNMYELKKKNIKYNKDQLISYYEYLIKKYPIISLEDPLSEEDYSGWKLLNEKIGNQIMLVGDDLFVTNYDRLKMGIDKSLANSILIKYNQIGTLTETLKTIKLAKENNYNIIISHRSGETNETFISDLSVALKAPFIKTGAPCRMERVAKYNRLLKIEEQI